MSESVYNQLRELSWRRKLTAAEESQLRACLVENPEAKAEWEGEAALNRLLEGLPEAPAVSSNFTAQVLQAVERAEAAQMRTVQKRRLGWWRVWIPRTAVAALAVGLGFSGVHFQEVKARRQMAQDTAQVYQIVAASNPELMEDFDAISRLSEPQAKADTELLALLQ